MNNTWFWFIQFNLKKQMWVNDCYGRLFDPKKKIKKVTKKFGSLKKNAYLCNVNKTKEYEND